MTVREKERKIERGRRVGEGEKRGRREVGYRERGGFVENFITYKILSVL